MKGFNPGAVKSQRFDDYPSNGQSNRVNFGNNDNFNQKRNQNYNGNYEVSGGRVNKRDNKYNEKSGNQESGW